MTDTVRSEDVVSDSKSGSMFSRLQTGSIRKPSSNRTTSPAPSPKAVTSSIQAERTEKARTVSAPVAPIPVPTASDLSRSERGTLRKRTTSGPNASQGNGIGETGEAPLIKPGQSILEQIGEPDHTGYMKKKAARYNTWKLRYFVLKGEHLYILRQNSKSVCRASRWSLRDDAKSALAGNPSEGLYQRSWIPSYSGRDAGPRPILFPNRS